ncbi:MAG: TolC family protein [Gemmatimonadetes bacterium]|nr:TolC family protein [Gemmatimonadota bacterium]
MRLPNPPAAAAAGALFVLALGAPGARGQDVRPDTLASVVGRSLQELVAALPGQPVTLRQVVSTALERSLDLEVARTQRHLADATLQTERGIFDPSLVAGWAETRDPNASGRSGTWSAGLAQALPWGTELGVALQGARTPAAGGAPTGHAADLALSLRPPLLEGLGTLGAGVPAAREGRRAAAAELARAQESAVAGVELAFWDLGEAEATQAVLQRSFEIAEALLFRNRQLADRQLVPEVDVITAQSGVALRRAGLISARQAREDAAERVIYLAWGAGASEQLAATTGPLTPAAAPTFAALPGAVDPRALEEDALAARQDAAAAAAYLAGAEALQGQARRAVLPSLTLEGGLTSTSSGSSFGGSLEGLDRRPTWSLGLAFSQPLLNRRDRGAGLSADLAVELRRLGLAVVENQVRQEVRSAARALAAGRQRLAAAEEAASLARAQLEAERRRLELGLGDSFRLLETEENAVQAELEDVRARYDLARALTLYRLAMGTVLEG